MRAYKISEQLSLEMQVFDTCFPLPPATAPATPHQQVKIINLPNWEKSPRTAKGNKSPFLPFLRLKERNEKVHVGGLETGGGKNFPLLEKKKRQNQ